MRMIDKLLNLGTAIAVLSSVTLVARMLRGSQASADARLASTAAAQHVNRTIKDWRSLKQGSGWIGDSTAPVTIVEFADFQCPYCRRFFSTEQTIRAKHPRDVAILFRNLPLSYHRFAMPAAVAAQCAAQQGRFERYHDVLFSLKQPLDSVSFARLAVEAGVPDTARFVSCTRDTLSARIVQSDVDTAKRIGARGTPTLIIDGLMLASMPTPDSLEKLIDRAKRDAPR